MLAKKPTMDFAELREKKLVKTSGTLTGKISAKEFEDHKTDAEEKIKQVDLDANPDVKTFAEKELLKNLMKHNDLQFQRLENQYRLAERKLGNKSEKLTEARDILSKSVDKYMDEIDRYVMQLTLTDGNLEAKAAVVDKFITEQGPGYDGLEGLGMYLIKGNKPEFSQLQRKFSAAKTKEDVYKVIKEFIDTDSGTNSKVLENAIDEMAKDLPKFEISRGETTYFQEKFKESDKGDKGKEWLGSSFGEDNLETAYKVLGTRFHIEFKKNQQGETTKEPEYIYDLLDGEIYKPNAEWDTKLKEVCLDDLADEKAIKDQMKELKERKEKRDDKVKELKEGKCFLPGGLFSDKVTGMRGIKNNDKLAEIMGMTKDHLDIINRGINPKIKEIRALAGKATDERTGRAMTSLSDILTPRTIRKSGLIGHMLEIIMAIAAALKSNDFETLDQIISDITSGKGLGEIKKNANKKKERVRQNYEKLLIKDPEPPLDELFTLYNDPKKLDKFYEKRSADDGEAKKLINMYPDLKKQVIISHLENKTGIKIMSLTSDNDVVNIGFTSKHTGKAGVFKITKLTSGPNKMKVEIYGGETIEAPEYSVAELKKVADKFEEGQKAEAGQVEATKKRELKIVSDALNDLAGAKNGHSTLMTLAKNHIPPKEMVAAEGETEKEKQLFLDEWIAATLISMAKSNPAFLKVLKEDPLLKDKVETESDEEVRKFAEKFVLYKDTLQHMITLGDPAKSSSPLKEMLELTDVPADEHPKWSDFKKQKNRTLRQRDLDGARYDKVYAYMKKKIKPRGSEGRLDDLRPFIKKLDDNETFKATLADYKAMTATP